MNRRGERHDDLGRIEVKLAEITGSLKQVDAKVDSTGRQAEQLVEILRGAVQGIEKQVNEIKAELPVIRRDAAHDASEVRVGVEKQLAEHINATNPHPHQEVWLRDHFRDAAAAIDETDEKLVTLKESVTEALSSLRTTLKILGPVGAVVTAVVTAAIVKALGAG